jgi:hypothetical protein
VGAEYCVTARDLGVFADEAVEPVPPGNTSAGCLLATVDHLQETFLPAIDDAWVTQDLTKTTGLPTTSVTLGAVYHTGYTSVYTIDKAGNQPRETYLPAISGPWITQALPAPGPTSLRPCCSMPTPAAACTGAQEAASVTHATCRVLWGSINGSVLVRLPGWDHR